MRFEGGVFVPSGVEPKELDAFFRHYAFVSRYLTAQNSIKTKTADNIANSTIAVTLQHGVLQNVQHGLGFTPSLVTSTSGRVEFLVVSNITSTSFIVRSKLLSTTIVNPVLGRPQNRVTVADPDFFQVGDLIRIGTKAARVTAIVDADLLLDAALVYSTYSLSLAQETARLFVF